MISRFYIDRPRFAFVIALLTLIAGTIAIGVLPVAQYPNITPSQVSVTASYYGADAVTTQNAVIEPLESNINGVKRMLYMSSIASDTGNASITVTFGIGTNGDLNTVNVQNKVNLGTAMLPQAVKQNAVVVKEKASNMLLAITLYSPDGSKDGVYLDNYTKLYIKDEIARIPGIAEVTMLGDRTYGMRVWLDPDKMAVRGVTVSDVTKAINAQNTPVASGSLGGAPSEAEQAGRYAVQTQGYLGSEDEFRNIVIKAFPDGSLLRIGDVGRVERGAANYDSVSMLDGKPSSLLAVYQLNDANGIEIAEHCRAKMDELAEAFPEGVEYGIQYDTTAFVEASIHEVVVTLIEALVLVILVTWIFLQNWRETLVPVVAIPVSLIGTFAVMLAVGYSINIVTLFGLILAIGVVVDDAIVVVENVNRLMHDEKLPPREATLRSMEEVTGPVIATTAVLLAMFVPVCFLSGITGEIYRQFGVTISVAVTISSINALTLSPALAATMFKAEDVNSPKKKFFIFRIFDYCFDKISFCYGRIVAFTLKRVFLMLVIFAGIVLLCGWLYRQIPTSFIPNEDQGIFFVDVQLPDTAPLVRTERTVAEATEVLMSIPGISNVITCAGYSIVSQVNSSNSAMIIVVLKDWEERKTPELSQTAIMAEAQKRVSRIPDGILSCFPTPAVPGIGTSGGFTFVVEDTTGTNPQRMQAVLNELIAKANDPEICPELSRVYTTFRSSVPQIYLNIDREKVMKLGISVDELNNALEGLLGYVYVNDYPQFGKLYKVEVQADQQFRVNEDSLKTIYVRSDKGKMIPISTFTKVETRFAPQYLSRYNRYSSANINGEPAPGYSSGEAMAAMERIGNEMPDGMRYEWTDMSYQEKLAAGQLGIILFLALLFIYLFLVAQYESWMIPVSVMASVPIAFAGALAFLYAANVENNLYTQVGFVLLFGMACKTAILIVEYAKLKREEGKSIYDAAMEAARLRFRAVLMTAISFVLGTMPLVTAVGAGAVSRRSLGTAVFGGMTVAAVLGTILIPVFYLMVQHIIEWKWKKDN